jgi:hypothetical protein
MNKKGNDKFLSPFLVFVMLIVGIAVVASVLIFYGANADVRGIEAYEMARYVLNCASENGNINEEFLDDEYNILDFCDLDEYVYSTGSTFYIRISLFSVNGESIRETKHYGQRSYEKDCSVAEALNGAENFPVCYIDKRYLKNNGEMIVIEVLSASNQAGEKNVIG